MQPNTPAINVRDFFKIALQKGDRISVGGKPFYLLRNSSVPQRLFKYRPVNEWLFPIFSEKRIYHAGKDSFNDPLDGINAYTLEFKADDIDTFFQKLGVNVPDPVVRQQQHRQLVEYFTAHPEEFERTFKRLFLREIEGFGISCFTTKCDNVLMWSHYAENHRGVCLEFDFSKEIEAITSGQLKITDSYMLCLRKVAYTKSTAVVNITAIFEERFSPVYHKADSWEYEDEYRSIRPAVGPYAFQPSCLVGVYFGLQASEETIDAVSRALFDNGFAHTVLKKMIARPDSYQLEARPLTER